VKTQARAFIGNSAVVPPGTCVPEGVLIGVASKAPSDMSPGDTWFGSPPMKLPVRETFINVNKNWTFEPSRWRQFGRGVIEAFSLSLPMALLATLTIICVEVLAVSSPSSGVPRLDLFVLAALMIPIVLTLMVAAAKWLVMGRYRPTTRPMWSWWALLNVRVDVLYSGVAAKMLLDQLRGTPMLPWMLRLFGTKIGKGTFMDTTDLTEFDCVEIGNFASLNAGSAPQTHLYEDRVMKVGRISIGDGAALGSGTTVLYDSTVGDFARLSPLTVVMKGESIPAHSEWKGAPAVPASQTARARAA
jgi:non-ribosomal peptide synthetase-like protein